jgi:excisionase family DNA binding protein
MPDIGTGRSSRGERVAPSAQTKAITQGQRRSIKAQMSRDRVDGGSEQAKPVFGGCLLTVTQAAEATQISERQIRRMIRAGKLPVTRFGKTVRIHPKHLGL